LLFVDFDQLLQSPSREVLKISKFIGRIPEKNIAEVLLRQRLPRKETSNQVSQFEENIKRQLSSEVLPLFKELVLEYENFWLRLVRDSEIWCQP
jgi:hypothetical protein